MRMHLIFGADDGQVGGGGELRPRAQQSSAPTKPGFAPIMRRTLTMQASLHCAPVDVKSGARQQARIGPTLAGDDVFRSKKQRMSRRWFVLCSFAIGLIAAIVPTTRSLAQGMIQARTLYALTVFSQPDRTSAIVGVLIPRAKVILEARNMDTTWVLGHSTDGRVRGWVESRFLELPSQEALPRLLFSNETVYVPVETDLERVYRTIDLNAYTSIPTQLGTARRIFERGRLVGNNPRVVSKIGDCISDNRHFLSPFGWREYTLGGYVDLQPVIDHFSESLAYDSLAAYDGLVTTAVLDPVFANPLVCQPGESPLHCELRVHRPAVAIIMFGAQDLLFTPPQVFDNSLRQIVHETIQAGVIPILSTFPGNLQRWQQAIAYNQIVVQIALDYDIPLMNLWRALYTLPNHGLNEDGRHLSLPLTRSGDLTPENLQRGYPLRNLIALQALDAVWRGAMY